MDTEIKKLPDSGARTNFETGAVRDAMAGKGLPSCIPTIALRAVSKRFEDGALKYGRDNWQKGIPVSRYIDSIYRHLWAFMEGCNEEDHLSAVMWNAMALYDTVDSIENDILPSELWDI